jgi:hypothetical protein
VKPRRVRSRHIDGRPRLMRPIHAARLDNRRPVLILTREVVRPQPQPRGVTVAPLTSTIRGLSTEVPVGPANGLDHPSVEVDGLGANHDNAVTVTDFALAHAALALLGHEGGASADVAASLAAAQRAVRRKGNDRERSLVDVVTARVRDCRSAGGAALVRTSASTRATRSR